MSTAALASDPGPVPPPAATAPEAPAFDDASRDALHVLPLAMMPMRTPGLAKSRLIKNARLETVVEVFHDRASGSGQVAIDHLGSMYPSFRRELQLDTAQLTKLAHINSFDVYTLRLELRRLGIAVNDHAALRLSDAKRGELTAYMRDFTQPLLQQVYGSEDRQIGDISDIMQLLAKPDRAEALRNLTLLSGKLRVKLQDIPTFLEEYGEIFLSLAYFRACLDGLVPEVQRFSAWLAEGLKNDMVARDRTIIRQMREVQQTLSNITTSITGRFEAFDRRSKDFWNDISADSFRAVRAQIESHHVTIGGVLCGLAVKTALWKERFPQGGGAPMKRVEFVRSEIVPGLDHINRIEKSAGNIA
ncbi:MAG TPA: hypothetical protein VED40_21345 [Azospirillaceae bacterium]|nr:hypothetical protein [Azospirillaceae bacterium]